MGENPYSFIYDYRKCSWNLHPHHMSQALFKSIQQSSLSPVFLNQEIQKHGIEVHPGDNGMHGTKSNARKENPPLKTPRRAQVRNKRC